MSTLPAILPAIGLAILIVYLHHSRRSHMHRIITVRDIHGATVDTFAIQVKSADTEVVMALDIGPFYGWRIETFMTDNDDSVRAINEWRAHGRTRGPATDATEDTGCRHRESRA